MQQVRRLKDLASPLASGEGSMCRKRICDPYARTLIKAATPGKANWAIEKSDMKNVGCLPKTPNACVQARGPYLYEYLTLGSRPFAVRVIVLDTT